MNENRELLLKICCFLYCSTFHVEVGDSEHAGSVGNACALLIYTHPPKYPAACLGDTAKPKLWGQHFYFYCSAVESFPTNSICCFEMLIFQRCL